VDHTTSQPDAVRAETEQPARSEHCSPPHSAIAGTPVLVFGEIDETADDLIELTWDGGGLSFPVPAGDPETGATVRLLQGSRMITDWESRYPSERGVAPLEKRQQNRIAARLVELSTKYGLASREMALVAVARRAGDRPGELPETQVVSAIAKVPLGPAIYQLGAGLRAVSACSSFTAL